ncbi:MAG: dephospho-CoA kinase [bacterium]
MIRIGLTGGMGMGKATVARMCARRGAFVVDADDLARSAVRPGRRAWRSVVKAFGKGVLKADGSIDRSALAEIVFGDRRKLDRLNAIVHPSVVWEMRRRFARAAREGKHAVAVANVPLLFEAGLEGEFDKTIVVTCPRKEQIKRCSERDGLSRREIERRIKMQLPIADKIRRSDCVIDNGGTLKNTERQVKETWKILTGGMV